ncbi:probable LRR receptor-like serine/threonine-protein kinase At1g56140 [Hibiscus syriacus]|uniref:probable LRR receptor-like serine/threonine-protein kinase At1g56140 n=1 Tax=Hibiscus syriacus TaxID=106335 RepID=UPI0019210A7F|nr:probable LRR receptor-like serine/threonine-protein kinase At1g56140 [Hibiscus syriacus]
MQACLQKNKFNSLCKTSWDKYYGIGLENGPYTVRLFFAETGFPERASESWRSLGRRVFDVYQGTRRLRDFDISQEAGGVNRAIIESRPRIVHRDVKASNILLDEKFCPNISDFGLEKLYDDKKTHVTTRATGTIGYLAPEYAMRGHLPEKVDVFGFGVVILEIMSGRPNSYNTLENDRIYLLEWAWTLHENNQPLSLLDPTLAEFDENEALRMIGVALLCTQASPSMRPPMSRVVGMLAGDIEVSNVTTKPSYITDWNFQDITDTFMDEETRTSIPSDHSNSDVNSKNKTTSGEDNQPIPSPVNMTEFKESIGEGR